MGAIPQDQYVDLLVKQLYGVAKTDTSTDKSPSNESIASPALNRGDTQWTQSGQIPAVASAVSGIVQAYRGASAVQCVPDTTTVPIGGIYPTWLTNLTNWIPQEFGSTYVVQVWVDNPGVSNPTVTGTQIFAPGAGGIGQYYFDNIAGLLNFIGETIPPDLTSGKVIYIVGYRYIGLVGVTNLPGNTNIGNLNFTGTTISSTNLNGNIVLSPNGTGSLNVTGVSNLGPVGNVKITGGTNGYVLQTDGTGNLSWTAQTGGGGNGTPGGSNTQIQFNNSGNFGGSSNFTFDSSSNTVTVTGPLIANTLTIGAGINEFCTSEVYFAVTTSSATDQVLYSIPAASIAGIDFQIIATDTVALSRSSLKISGITYAGQVAFAEYAGLQISGGVGSFSVAYNPGATPTVGLYVSPNSSNRIVYKILITRYAP